MGFIIFRSVTYAQRGERVLARAGISAYILKPPVSLGQGSCSYTLKVRADKLRRALEALRRARVPFGGVFVLEEGYYKEANL